MHFTDLKYNYIKEEKTVLYIYIYSEIWEGPQLTTACDHLLLVSVLGQSSQNEDQKALSKASMQ